MADILYVTFIGFLTGIVGTLGGGLLVILLKKVKESFLTFILGISAGIMTVVVFLELIPEALNMGSTLSTLSGMLLGVGLIGLLDYTFPHQHFQGKKTNTYYKAGILLSLGIAIHNIPEGLAIGAGYSAAQSLGLGLALVIGIHNVPEGIAVATSLLLAGMNNIQIIIITFLAGLPMGLGAFIGSYLGNISPFFLSLSLGFAAGAMLFVTFDELLPTAQEKNQGKLAIIGILTGVFLGILITG